MSVLLSDLQPRWIGFSAIYIDGLSMTCPQCGKHRIVVRFSPPIDPELWADRILKPSYDKVWNRSGDSFETISLQPSIQSDSCHFTITAGQVVFN